MVRKISPPQKTKKDVVIEVLRSAILSGELEPGERLTQEDLAERFNVSMTPVREAIQQLVAEGVLSHSPYKGVQVAEVSLEDISEIYLIRSVVENLATCKAVPNLKISDVQKLHTLHEQIIQQVEKGDLTPLRKLNYEFHMLIYKAADMPHLYKIIKTLWSKSPWDTLYVVPHRPERIVEEHKRVMEAIDRGDATLAGQHMQTHLEEGMKMLIEYLTKST
ncbi:MAG: GntR family transcriptional regulator [Chloroflexota bacterium]